MCVYKIEEIAESDTDLLMDAAAIKSLCGHSAVCGAIWRML